MLILWWLSQTLDQTVAPQLTLSGRRFEEADNLSCELQNEMQLTKLILDVVQFHKQSMEKCEWQFYVTKLRQRNIRKNAALTYDWDEKIGDKY